MKATTLTKPLNLTPYLSSIGDECCVFAAVVRGCLTSCTDDLSLLRIWKDGGDSGKDYHGSVEDMHCGGSDAFYDICGLTAPGEVREQLEGIEIVTLLKDLLPREEWIILVPRDGTAGCWHDLGEGPFPSKERAEDWGKCEVGTRWTVAKV